MQCIQDLEEARLQLLLSETLPWISTTFVLSQRQIKLLRLGGKTAFWSTCSQFYTENTWKIDTLTLTLKSEELSEEVYPSERESGRRRPSLGHFPKRCETNQIKINVIFKSTTPRLTNHPILNYTQRNEYANPN